MIYNYQEIQFLDLTIYVENGFLNTKVFLWPQTAMSIWMYYHSTKKQYLDPFQSNDSSEFVRAKSEYSNFLLTASHHISSIDNAFQNVQLLSEEI